MSSAFVSSNSFEPYFDEDEVHMSYNLYHTFSTSEYETKYIDSSNLKKNTKYYGVVTNKSSNYVSGSVAFNDLD